MADVITYLFVIGIVFMAVGLGYTLMVLDAHERVIRKLDALLTCWAENWTDPPETMKAKLEAVLKGLPHEPPQTLGMDCNLGQLWFALTGRR